MITPHSRLSDLVMVWYDVHGSTLKDAKYRLSRTLLVCERMGDPCFSDFSARIFAEYRQARICDVSPATVNHETRYLRSVFNELVRLDFIEHNPIANVRTFTVSDSELSYLTDLQIDSLFQSLKKSRNNSVYMVAKVCLSVGSRWGETEKVRHIDLLSKPNKAIRFVDTKNGKTRVVPVSDQLFDEIFRLRSNEGRHMPIFESCRSAFRSAVKRAGIQLHEQQLTHVLRHTFASHYLMNGGQIFTLQRILGHSDIKTTMRYVHFSRDYLSDAVAFNPANRLDSVQIINSTK